MNTVLARLVFETSIVLSQDEIDKLPKIGYPKDYIKYLLDNRKAEDSELYIKHKGG